MVFRKLVFCFVLLLLFVDFSIAFSDSAQKISECRKNCDERKKIAISECYGSFDLCDSACSGHIECRKHCYREKVKCFREKISLFSLCSKDCRYTALNISLDCVGGYKAGQMFLRGCDKCFCNFDGKIKCEKTHFCNFDNVSLSKESCVSAGGLFQPLCNGPHFDLVCTVENYCICGGKSNFSCPKDYFCVTDFLSPNKRKAQTINGWKNQLGQSLGEIGVCAQKPSLSKCGNGVCDNLVMRDGWVAETKYNCPEDCH